MKCDRCKKKEATQSNGLCLDCEILERTNERVREAVSRVSAQFNAENERYRIETDKIFEDLSAAHKLSLDKSATLFDELLATERLRLRGQITVIGIAFVALFVGVAGVVAYAIAKGTL